jgi:hypothetical protein
MTYSLKNDLTAGVYNPNVAWTGSWIHVHNDAQRPLFAQAAYVTNFADMPIMLSAADVQIGGVEIKDWDSDLRADVTASDGLNALRVLTQDLESSVDDITIGDKQGNFATVKQSTSSLNVNVTNTINSITTPEPTQLDAFGRLRISNSFTLFDSSHRYEDNNLWSSLTAVEGTYAFNLNQGLIEMTVSSLSGSSVIRETTKVFAYQPGKSLLVLNTFVMAPSTENLSQRVGYFGSQNGIYFQLDGDNIGLVKRSLVSGSVTDNVVLRSNWNGDKLDGTGSSGIVLDITKAQIFWMDIEWLGVGTVRTGFVINGQFIVCHSFHHANLIDSTYITTASLPLRYEIVNKAATNGSNTLKQICSSVISEGGYELRGLQQAVGTAITGGGKILTNAGTYYPVVSLKLRTDRLDAIVVPTAIAVIGSSDGIYNWQIRSNTTTTGGTWLSAGVDSAVEYNLTGTGISEGRTLASGYFITNNFAKGQIDILREAIFKFQLERNGLTGTPFELSLVMASNGNGDDVYGSLDWEEVSR